MRILWVKSGPLFPLNTGGRRRTHAMLAELARRHHVTYLANLPEGQTLAEGEAEAPYAARKIWIPSREPAEGTFAWARDVTTNLLLSTQPYVLDRYRNPDLAAKLLEFDASGDFDVIVCDFLTPAVNFDFDRLRTPAFLFQHNVEAQIWRRLAEEKGNPLVRLLFRDQWRRMAAAEASLAARFRGVVAVSPEDAAHHRDVYGLANLLGAVPTGVDTEQFRPPEPREPETGTIGFLGSMDWMPNIECVVHFAREILPAVRARRTGARFLVICRDPAPAVRRLAEEDPGIELTGTVEDVRAHLDRCELLVVPLRSGGGTRIKIFEAMAQGVPVVSTRIGAEGLPVRDREHLLLADDPSAFADAVVEMLSQPQLAADLASRARELVVRDHGWDAVAAAFVALIEGGTVSA